MTARIWTA